MPAGLMRKPIAHRRNRRKNLEANKPQPSTPILITSTAKSTVTLTLNFDQPVTLKGIPAYTTNLAGVTPVSATRVTPLQVNVVFTASIAAANTLNIPFREPSIRNMSGGFVTPNTFGI